VAPFAPNFLPAPDTAHAHLVHNIFSLRAERNRRDLKRRMEALGIAVLPAAPRDTLPLLLRKMGQHRQALSRVPR
jgi:hypothetical protein